jgi:glucose/arabinose dehydrogenase
MTVLLAAGLASGLPALAQQAAAPRSPTPAPVSAPLRVDTVARGLDHPWAVAFLPDGRLLVTERPGRLRVVHPDGRLSEPLAGVPDVAARGQGGLLDVALDARFAENRLVYLSYAEPGPRGTAGTAVARGRLGDGRLEGTRVIYRQQPKVSGGNHFGSRLVFARDGTLFVTQGDRFAYREQAQDLSSGLGKIVRIDPDGSIPRVAQSGSQAVRVGYQHSHQLGEAPGRDRQRGARSNGGAQAEENLGRTPSLAVAADQAARLHAARAGG